MNNFKNPDFYLGVVEDRMDPLKLGRVRVRILGLHTHEKTLLPTADLPWALKVQPTTSGAMSGIGHSPVGLMEGTWVLVQFIDPDKQVPFVMGAIGGIPQETNPPIESFSLTGDSNSSTIVSSEEPAPAGTTQPEAAPVVDPDWKTKTIKRLGELESGSKYSVVNSLGYLGKYQFGAPALTDRGHVKKGTTNKQLDDPTVWTGKSAIANKQDFLSNGPVQEQVMSDQVDANYKTLKRTGVPMDTLTDAQKGGLIAAAHLYGPGGAKQFYNGVVKADAYGTTTEKYYKEGYKAVAGVYPESTSLASGAPAKTPDKVADENKNGQKNTSPSDDAAAGEPVSTADYRRNSVDFLDPTIGFKDPNLVYPLKTHLQEPDTNRLARHEKIEETIVFNKEQNRHTGVDKANGKGSWDQSPIPYNSKYPFNNVWQSEAGHLLEFDDTKGRERTHLYHAKGTFTEVDHNGTQVNFIVGDGYVIMERNGYVHVVGNMDVNVEGAKTLKVSDTMDVQINGNATINIHANASINVAGNLDMTAGGSFNIKAGTFAVDAGRVDLNSGVASGLSAIGAIGGSAVSSASLNVLTRGDEVAVDYEIDADADAAQIAAVQQALVDKGILTADQASTSAEVLASETITPNTKEGTPVKEAPEGTTVFDYNEKFSRHYTLGDLTAGGSRKLVAQAGLTPVQIYNNLKALANNVLDLVKDAYPSVRINSGFRTSVPAGGSSTSQHMTGQAVDISFSELNRSEIYDRVIKVEKLVPYDQMLLEYLTPGGNGWIHISYKNSGNRKMVFTMNNHQRVGQIGTFSKIA